MSQLHALAAHQLLAMYGAGTLSPVEVAHAVIERIEQLNSSVNAFCLVDAERALDNARQSEQRWQAHRHSGAAVGALEGVPASIKDQWRSRWCIGRCAGFDQGFDSHA